MVRWKDGRTEREIDDLRYIKLPATMLWWAVITCSFLRIFFSVSRLLLLFINIAFQFFCSFNICHTFGSYAFFGFVTLGLI